MCDAFFLRAAGPRRAAARRGSLAVRVALGLAAPGLAALGLAACGRPVCQNHITQASPSPDGTAIAFVFDHGCGPQGAVSTHVSLIALHDALRDGTGNVLALADRQPVTLAWRSPTELVISGALNPTFRIDEPWGRVHVEFRGR